MTSANPTIVPLVAGTILGGKYRVEAPLAEGGMSLVLLARDIAIDEQVALKLLRPEQRLQRDVLARFVREAKTIRRIQSDRCVKVHDVGMDPVHGPFMVMELLEGASLRTLLDAGQRFVPRRACELALQMCEALAAAHAIGCIHRDVKPDNVVVIQRGEIEDVRVLDFGISKHALTGSVLDQDISLINTISLMGSPAYMSPEQMRHTSKADERSDIWSLGAVLFEMVTGRPPFLSESITELCSMVITEEPPLASLVEPAVPGPLAEVIQRCLQKNPADRYQNVGQLARALLEFAPRGRLSLERVLAALGSGAGVASPPESDDDFRESTLILPAVRGVPSRPALAAVPPPSGAPASYPPFLTPTPPPSFVAGTSANIAFSAPTTPRRPLSAMPTVVSVAKAEERRRSKRWIAGMAVLAAAAFLMLFAGIDARARRSARAAASAHPTAELPAVVKATDVPAPTAAPVAVSAAVAAPEVPSAAAAAAAPASVVAPAAAAPPPSVVTAAATAAAVPVAPAAASPVTAPPVVTAAPVAATPPADADPSKGGAKRPKSKIRIID